jgi:hypothetical protein
MKLLAVDTIEEARQKLLACVSRWNIPIEKKRPMKSLGESLPKVFVRRKIFPAFAAPRLTVMPWSPPTPQAQGKPSLFS